MIEFFEENNVTTVDIFSFAIRDDDEKAQFERNIKPSLEREFHIKVDKVFTVFDVTMLIRRHCGAMFEPWEVPLMWGKQRSFLDIARFLSDDNELVLIDDMVEDATIINHKRGLRIELVNAENRTLRKIS